MRSNLNDWTQRSNHSIRKVHAQNYDIFSEPLLDYLNLSCCRQISASLYGPSKPENWPKIELLHPCAMSVGLDRAPDDDCIACCGG